jgi:hypothetical protein
MKYKTFIFTWFLIVPWLNHGHYNHLPLLPPSSPLFTDRGKLALVLSGTGTFEKNRYRY